MPPSDQLPAIVSPGGLATPADTYIVPALIADLGDTAGWRYVEFFTANINNDHTRRAYARACKHGTDGLCAGGAARLRSVRRGPIDRRIAFEFF
jgi:hypothetical protein